MPNASATRVPPPTGRCRDMIENGETANTTATVRSETWNGPAGNVGRARNAIGTGIRFTAVPQRGTAACGWRGGWGSALPHPHDGSSSPPEADEPRCDVPALGLGELGPAV